MFGLYDIDGILRFTCTDREACLAYAELLELPKGEYSLMDFPELDLTKITDQKKGLRRQAKNNN